MFEGTSRVLRLKNDVGEVITLHAYDGGYWFLDINDDFSAASVSLDRTQLRILKEFLDENLP